MLNTGSACCHNRQCSTCNKTQDRLPECVVHQSQRTRQPQQSLCPPRFARTWSGKRPCPAPHATTAATIVPALFVGRQETQSPSRRSKSERQTTHVRSVIRSFSLVPHTKRAHTRRPAAKGQPHRASRTRSRRHQANRNERSDEDETGRERPCLPPSPPHTA